MKVGDIVKTLDSLKVPHRLVMSGLVIAVLQPEDKEQTPRLVILKEDGKITSRRASYNILEVIDERPYLC